MVIKIEFTPVIDPLPNIMVMPHKIQVVVVQLHQGLYKGF